VNGHALLALQRIDTQLDQLAGERKRLPEHGALAAANARLKAWTSEDARLRGASSAAAATIAEAERAGSELATTRNRLEAQLRTVTSTREADALTHELETLRQQQSDLDDRELVAMEAQSDADAALADLATQQDEIRSTVESASVDLDRALERLGVDEGALQRLRADAEAALTDQQRALYERLRTRFGGVGIAELEGRRCSGCHLDLSAAEAEQVLHAPADELPECPHCGRVIAR
jgi:predicted  nucleic acid-binding Zn-ribbon protein